MAIKTITQGKLTWINIDKIDDEALTYLRTNYQFHHLDYEDLSNEQETPKIDTYKNYLFVILQFPQWQPATQTIISHEIDIFVGKDYLITIQHSKSKEMKNFFYRCMNNRKIKNEWMSSNSGYLLYHIIESLFRQSRPLLNRLGKELSAVEDTVFGGIQGTDTVKRLAVLRRNVLSLRRIIDPQRYMTGTLAHTRKEFIDESHAIYFDNVGDYLNKIWAITDTYRDTISGLHVTVESLINQRTNNVIGALTVISVALLPLTLFSGLYGMNISGLPFADRPGFVWLMFLGLTAVILIVIAVMRKRRWLG